MPNVNYDFSSYPAAQDERERCTQHIRLFGVAYRCCRPVADGHSGPHDAHCRAADGMPVRW